MNLVFALTSHALVAAVTFAATFLLAHKVQILFAVAQLIRLAADMNSGAAKPAPAPTPTPTPAEPAKPAGQ